MIMFDVRFTRRPNPVYASALGRYIHDRRLELGLTVAEAAELTGMEFCHWAALEGGWVPQDDNLIRSIAATLEVVNAQIAILAMIALHNQPQAA